MNNVIKKWAKALHGLPCKGDDVQMANKHMKRFSLSCVPRELPIEETVTCPHWPTSAAKTWNPDDAKCPEGVQPQGPHSPRGTCNMARPLCKALWQLLTQFNIPSPYNPATALRGIDAD